MLIVRVVVTFEEEEQKRGFEVAQGGILEMAIFHVLPWVVITWRSALYDGLLNP